jgi:hypothetical protein
MAARSAKMGKTTDFQTGGNRDKRRNPLFAPVEKFCPFYSHRLQLKMHHLVCGDHV